MRTRDIATASAWHEDPEMKASTDKELRIILSYAEYVNRVVKREYS